MNLYRSLRKICWLTALVAMPSATGFAAYEPIPEDLEKVDYEANIKQFLGEYCIECHSNDEQKADLNLEQYQSAPLMYQERELWEAVRDMLELRDMPPSKKPQPSEMDRKMAVLFIDKELAKFDCSDDVSPGRVTLRRLNRVEYRNTVQDLTGIQFDPSSELPLDEVGYGFDNIGDVLSMSPILMEKYLGVADKIVEEAIVTDRGELMPRKRLQGRVFSTDSDDAAIRPIEDGGWALMREGTLTATHDFSKQGKYEIQIEAFGDQAGGEPPKMEVKLGDRSLSVIDVPVTQSGKQTYTVTVEVEPGKKPLSISYLNNFNSNGDRNLYFNHVEVVGPVDGAPPEYPESHRMIIPEPPQEGSELQAAKQYLKTFATRAFRRPVDPQELEQLTGFVEAVMSDGGSFEEGMQVAATAVLVSPKFLFRWELDSRPDAEQEGVRYLDDYELASRLSYFLWSSMPDDELLRLAGEEKLKDTQVLEQQVKRMLQDERADELVRNFAGQWLQTRNFDASPDPKLFPEFSEELAKDMKRETELFFGAIMREDRSLLELLDADFTYLNERLARHYGIEGVEGEAFRRVELGEDTRRGGILTQASILTLTSNPTRTSPVMRGKWILEQILGAPPPPPPPNVPELEEESGVDHSASLRKRLEQHRENPECATCHEKLDPLGFALENFDAIGGWRDMDGQFPIDPSGSLPDGRSFNGPLDLKSMLRNDDGFVETATRKMLTFALGRGLEYYDKCAVDAILAEIQKDGYKFSSLVLEIVKSAPFQQRATPPES